MFKNYLGKIFCSKFWKESNVKLLIKFQQRTLQKNINFSSQFAIDFCFLMNAIVIDVFILLYRYHFHYSNGTSSEKN